MCISMILPGTGITNTIGRVFYGWLSDKGWIRSITVNNLTLTACGIITIFVPIYTTYSWLTVYSALFGFLIAAFVCLTSVILVEHLGLKRLTNAFGLLILVRGFACLIGSPLAGYVYTKTENYNASFVFSGVLIVLAGVISFCIPMIEKWRVLGKNARLFGGNGLVDSMMDDEEIDDRLTVNNSRRLDDIVEALAEQEFNKEKDESA
uniref:Major facilitator superfamily (MFS) profile domain-containing protein n=1 Tax=Romanomermis culicivorax TaxID=13658 RepID=A0A915JLI6_ROMCU